MQDIDNLTFKWFQQAQVNNMLQEKAREFVQILENDQFKASNGWLLQFKTRHNINQATVCDESESVDMRTVEDGKAKLPEIIADYNANNIFNLDESRVFYRALPSKIFRVKGDNCTRGKKSKDLITAAFCCNLAGDFEKSPSLAS